MLGWYDTNARDLPWRVGPAANAVGERADPYRVWLSEIMLQQTTVPHATPYFHAFVARWPTVEALAAADDADVMAAWAGLGYYARARNLLACARVVTGEHDRRFPETEAGLRTLPGVGAYTAAAIAAIAFDEATNVVDGNVERVVSRLFAVEAPLPGARGELARLAGILAEGDRPGDWAQALMDLGSAVCIPKSPKCRVCPLVDHCAAWRRGDAGAFPRKARKAERPHRHGVAFVLRRAGQVGLVHRAPKGLLGGMLGLPTSDWSTVVPDASPPVAADWREAGSIDHVFTHFSLTLVVRVGEGEGDFIWTPEAKALSVLPTVFRKALERGLA